MINTHSKLLPANISICHDITKTIIAVDLGVLYTFRNTVSSTLHVETASITS